MSRISKALLILLTATTANAARADEYELNSGWEHIPYGTSALEYRFYEFCPYTFTCTFDIVSGPEWLDVYNYAYLSGDPKHADIGVFSVELRATNEAGATKIVAGRGEIREIKTPPRWISDPLHFPQQHKVGERFAAILSRHLGGGVGYDKFEVIGAPAWLTADHSYLHGTPSAADVGDVEFKVRVVGPTGLNATAKVKFTVVP